MVASILLVEDDPGISRLLEIHLSRTHDVRCAYTAQEAIDAVAEHDFDIVVLDVLLPDRPCWDVLATLNEKKATAHILVMTGYADSQIVDQALALGAHQVITKPVTPAKLKHAIDSMLNP